VVPPGMGTKGGADEQNQDAANSKCAGYFLPPFSVLPLGVEQIFDDGQALFGVLFCSRRTKHGRVGFGAGIEHRQDAQENKQNEDFSFHCGFWVGVEMKKASAR
jgi:hypothetical protein